MKKALKYLLASAAAALVLTACWNDELPDDGAGAFNRHQVEDLTVVPGDEEVELSWTMPEGWNPTDFIVHYISDEDDITLYTDGAMNYKVINLVNDMTYKFSVHAVYGDLISGAVTATAKPTTARIKVYDLKAVADDEQVILTWTRPSTQVLHYDLEYFMADTPDQIEKKTVDGEATSYTVTGLTNDKNYTFTLYAVYEKGSAEGMTAKAMPTKAIPYFLSTTTPVQHMPMTFTFNKEGYPTATGVKWTFPTGESIEGENATYAFTSTGEQTVKLEATVNDEARSWNISIEDVREYVIYFQNWFNQDSGFAGLNYTCPCFSPDGKTVYVSTTENSNIAVYAFDIESGQPRWYYKDSFGTDSYNRPVANPINGDVYFGENGLFVAITAGGQKRWSFDNNGALGGLGAGAAVSADGSVVYTLDNKGMVFALDAMTGAQKWAAPYNTGATTKGGGLLVNGTDLVVGTETGIFFLSTAEGKLLTDAPITHGLGGTEVLNYTGFSVSPDKKTAYFSAGTNSAVGALDLAGRKLIHATKIAGDNMFNPVVGPDGRVVVGTKDGHLFCLEADGKTVVWDIQAAPDGKTKNAFNFSRPCVDSKGNIYIVAGGSGNSNTNLIIDKDGKKVDDWNYIGTNPQFSQSGQGFLNGVFYTCLYGNNKEFGLFAGKYVGDFQLAGYDPDADPSQWKWMSCSGGDICGSCCIR